VIFLFVLYRYFFFSKIVGEKVYVDIFVALLTGYLQSLCI